MARPGGHGSRPSTQDLVRSAFGRWIRNHRNILGLSQAGLLRRLEHRGVRVSQSALSRWETGEACPPLELVPALTDCLGATLASAEEVLARSARAAADLDLTGRSPGDLRREADRAARAGNFHRALPLYEAALDLLRLGDSPPDPPAEAAVLLPLAWVHYNLWHLELARDTLRRLGSLPGLPPAARLRRHLLRVALEHRYGDDELAAVLAADAERRLDELRGEDHAFACHALGQFRFSIEQYGAAVPLLRQARAGWQELANRLETARVTALLGYSLARAGEDPGAGERLLREAADMADGDNHRDVSCQARRLLGDLLLRRGNVADGMALLENSISLARRSGLAEEEFLAVFYAWERVDGETRHEMERRLRRLLPRVHPLLPEARRFREALANPDGREEEDDR